jgi:FHS family L-fucose permease-like MFS transporter
MSLGLIIMAIGALLFIPAANARTYWVFLLAIFIQGAGMTLLQTASNPYITILGPIESAAKRIAIMGIANKVAGALGSVIFGAILLSGIDGIKEKLNIVDEVEKANLLNTMADSVITPYIIMAIVLFLLEKHLYQM